MSYRTYINDTQIFGNNLCFNKWIDFIRSQGIFVDGDQDDGYFYDGDIIEVDKALGVLEEIVYDIQVDFQKKRPNSSIYNLTEDVNFWCNDGVNGQGIYDACTMIIENNYMFLPYNFVKACGDNIEEYFICKDGRLRHIKLTASGVVHVHAS